MQATMLDPPALTKGRVIPVAGRRAVMTPKWMAACRVSQVVQPAARSIPIPSGAWNAMRNPR